MDYYEKIKQNQILNIAFSLGYDGEKSGSAYQGNCPRHGSEGGKCLVIWPKTQRFKCFHCGEAGDVIDLVVLFKRCDHKIAINFLADRIGLTHLHEKELLPEEIEKREADLKERMLIQGILTEATEW